MKIVNHLIKIFFLALFLIRCDFNQEYEGSPLYINYADSLIINGKYVAYTTEDGDAYTSFNSSTCFEDSTFGLGNHLSVSRISIRFHNRDSIIIKPKRFGETKLVLIQNLRECCISRVETTIPIVITE
jgi:hypothetical protein